MTKWSTATTQLRRLAQKNSTRFDALIAAALLRLTIWLENSPVAHSSQGERLLRNLRANQHEAGDWDGANGAIVTQAQAEMVSPKAVRLFSGGARVGMVGMALVLFVVIWPRPATLSTSQAASRNTPTPEPTPTAGLAIINPANRADGALESSPPSIVTLSGAAEQNSGSEAPLVTVETLPGHELSAILSTDNQGVSEDGATSGPRREGRIMIAQPHAVAAASIGNAGGIVLIDPALAAGTANAAEPTPVAPMVNIVSTINFDFTPTPEPTPTSAVSPTPTPVPVALAPGRLWSNFAPEGGSDHFWIGRPFPESVGKQLASPNYQFGSTAGGRYRIHHGIDISNPQGTPVQAAVSGEVVHAGPDDPELLGPYNGFYGNAVVIRLDQKLPVAGGEMNVYVLYGHLSEVVTEVGRRVEPTDVVGRVGMTGIAIGPHLHVEVRLGVNDYEHSVNPYLWVQPLDNAGAVAVRLLTADGRTWPGARLTLARFENGRAVWARVIETYRDNETIGPNPMWGENGAMGSVPPGFYVLVGNVNGQQVRAELTVEAGKTTFVELRTR